MNQIKIVFGLLVFCHQVFAQNVGPTSHFGTGQQYANAPCPYQQSGLPNSVIKRSERLKNLALDINARLASAQGKLDAFADDKVFAACRQSVNHIIKKACGGDSSELRGEEAVDQFEDHMRGSLYISRNTNYLRTYQVVTQGIQTSKMYDQKRMLADASGSDIGADDALMTWDDEELDDKGGDSPIVTTPSAPSCYEYTLNDGIIDHKICFSTGETNSKIKQNCKNCLKPNGTYPRGVYPEKFKEYYDLQQEVAQLKRDYQMAQAKALCVDRHIDGATSAPDSDAFRTCILTADPMATAADYCLYCDDAGRAETKKKGFDLERWGPSLLTAGLWIAGGLYANKEMKETRQGNWEAGYPSDDRSPWVMTNYVMNGAGAVVNSLQAAGAFGCSPSSGVSGQGQTVASGNIMDYVQGIFSGNANVGVGGALGYPGSMLGGGQGSISGGIFGGNPTAGPWGASGGINIEAERARIAQEQANLDALIRQNQQNQASLEALAQLQATLVGLEQQNIRTQQDMAAVRAQAAAIYGNLNSGYGYGNGGAGAGLNGGLRIGFDVQGWGGVGAGYGGGAPGTGYPPYGQPPYNGPGGIPNYSDYNGGGSGDDYNDGPDSGLGVPGLGL